MNLAIRDVRHRLGRFLLTALGLGLLLGTVMAMGGIYRGLVEDALALVRMSGANLWVVQKDTNGPFAETSRLPEDVVRAMRAVPGVRDASPVAFQTLQLRVGAKPFRVQLVGHPPAAMGAPPAVAAGRPMVQSRYEMLIDRRAGVPLGTDIRIGRQAFTVVGLTDGLVSSSGDPAAFVSLRDAQGEFEISGIYDGAKRGLTPQAFSSGTTISTRPEGSERDWSAGISDSCSDRSQNARGRNG